MNTARYAEMSDPDCNFHFRRLWAEPHPRRNPAALDRMADFHLQHGHHRTAERLAHEATRLRQGGRL